LYCNFSALAFFTQAGSQDVTHHDIEPYTEVTMGMDDDDDDGKPCIGIT